MKTQKKLPSLETVIWDETTTLGLLRSRVRALGYYLTHAEDVGEPIDMDEIRCGMEQFFEQIDEDLYAITNRLGEARLRHVRRPSGKRKLRRRVRK